MSIVEYKTIKERMRERKKK